jgi:hypothetical protein
MGFFFGVLAVTARFFGLVSSQAQGASPQKMQASTLLTLAM